MGPIAFSAQYQQSPIPPGGTIIKRKWLTPYDHDRPPTRRPHHHELGSRAQRDRNRRLFCLCRAAPVVKKFFYILEVVLGRFPFDALKRKVMEVKQLYGSVNAVD